MSDVLTGPIANGDTRLDRDRRGRFVGNLSRSARERQPTLGG